MMELPVQREQRVISVNVMMTTEDGLDTSDESARLSQHPIGCDIEHFRAT